jgi:putative Holliday junction resolvase
MKELLAIDYGAARCGLALASLELKVAMPYKVVSTKDLLAEITAIAAEREIERIIVGLPLTITGQPTAQTKVVEKFVEKLKNSVGILVETFPEGLSTRLAESLGKGSDDEAAAVILGAYLEKGLTEN